jgi:DNA replication licensing factor MCM6
MDYPSSSGAASSGAPSSPLGARANGAAAPRIDPLAFGAPSTRSGATTGHAAAGTSAGGSAFGDVDMRGGDDDDGGAAPQEYGAGAGRQARPRAVQNLEDVQPVTDEVGERVREGFAEFLET